MELASRVLYGIAAMLLLLALAVRIAPASARPVAAPSPEAAAPQAKSVKSSIELPGTSSAIVAGNVFSPSRTPPRVRFVPPDLVPPAPARKPRRGVPGSDLRLFGTVVGPAGTAALIDADPAVRGAEIYAIGDVVRGRRIVAVSESTVVLDGVGGRIVLRLQPVPQPTP